MLALLLIIALALAPARAQPVCNMSTVTTSYTGGPASPNNINLTIVPEGPIINVTVVVNTSSLPLVPVDVYFLWETSFNARVFSHQFWQPYTPDSERLFLLMRTMREINPGIKFGLGFYTTKRLAGLGTLRVDDFYNTDYVFKPITPVTDVIGVIDSNMITTQWASTPAAANVSSALEALMHVMIVGDTDPNIRFRPGSRRVLVVAACSQVGVEGDVLPRLLSQALTEYPGGYLFPGKNDYDGVLENDCALYGVNATCYTEMGCMINNIGTPNTLAPDVDCSCPLRTGTISALNMSQFTDGSCEDFPTPEGAANATSGVSFEYEIVAFVPNVLVDGNPTDFSGGQNSDFFQMVIDQLVGGRGHVINNTNNLGSFLVNAYPPSPAIPIVTFVPTPPIDVISYELLSCNDTECVFVFTFNYTSNATGVYDILIGSDVVTVQVSGCDFTSDSQSASHESQSHRSLSKSDSGSHVSPSKSLSRSHRSASHHSGSDSHSKSHASVSESRSRSHQSKSHHSASHRSASHHSKSDSHSKSLHSKSHHSDSTSDTKSHHSVSHHSGSGSHSKSHRSKSESSSQSHASKSTSHESLHLNSYSMSHHSGSRSHRSASHQSHSHHSKSHGSKSLSGSASHHTVSRHSHSHHSGSDSHSVSHHSSSQSHSNSHQSKSSSHESLHVNSYSKSHRSESKSHRSASHRSHSHHSVSHNSHSDSRSNSHHSKSHRSHSHHSPSKSHSASHYSGSDSGSKSHHSKSHRSVSHHSGSESGTASHHSLSDSSTKSHASKSTSHFSHHLKSHSPSHHSVSHHSNSHHSKSHHSRSKAQTQAEHMQSPTQRVINVTTLPHAKQRTHTDFLLLIILLPILLLLLCMFCFFIIFARRKRLRRDVYTEDGHFVEYYWQWD
jgi:hypothetical protein